VATAAANSAAQPQWQQLTLEVRRPVVAALTQMIQQHLPVGNATAAKEVANESH